MFPVLTLQTLFSVFPHLRLVAHRSDMMKTDAA
jgi:hypothetical protein